MRVLDILVLLVLIALLIGGMYIFWLNVPMNLEYETYIANATAQLPAQSYQFYPNMRYINRTITYAIAEECSTKKRGSIKEAFAILEAQSVLRFTEAARDGEIAFLCSTLPSQPESAGHFVAGEGGPTQIINTTRYAAILSGKVALYRSEKCERPIIALHEVLHALGFDHTSDKKSIMFPITDCEQQLDAFIVEQINLLYQDDDAPDLAIERVEAHALGRYLDFEIAVANYGLKDTRNATLALSTSQEAIKTFPLNELGFGQRKILTVHNVRIPRNVDELEFSVTPAPGERDLFPDNNAASVRLQPDEK